MEPKNYEEIKSWLSSADPDGNCPVKKALGILEGKWKIRVLFELSKKPALRFGELKKSVPMITNTMLSATLKELETQGIVKRVQFNEIPPHVEYSLTEKGIAFLPCLFELSKWGTNFL